MARPGVAHFVQPRNPGLRIAGSNTVLRVDRARVMKADAVINIKYKSGIGLMTWGYIDANGVAVKFTP
jgi:uncharacterized protein YbjQ (UPF0145 family)